jgi:hypothetical protein
VGRTCRTHRREERCIQNFSRRKIWSEETTHRWKYNTELDLTDVVLKPVVHSRSHRDWSQRQYSAQAVMGLRQRGWRFCAQQTKTLLLTPHCIVLCVFFFQTGMKTNLIGIWEKSIPTQIIVFLVFVVYLTFVHYRLGVRGDAGWGTALRVGEPRVQLPMGSLGFFIDFNHSGRIMALGSTQSLTKISTRSISWKRVKAAGAKDWQPCHLHTRIV